MKDVGKKKVQEILEDPNKDENGFLDEDSTREIMIAYGLPIIKMDLAKTPKEASVIADEIGFPVVLKISSPDVIHKSDIGGVMLNVPDAISVEHGFDQIVDSVKNKIKGAKIDGIGM